MFVVHSKNLFFSELGHFSLLPLFLISRSPFGRVYSVSCGTSFLPKGIWLLTVVDDIRTLRSSVFSFPASVTCAHTICLLAFSVCLCFSVSAPNNWRWDMYVSQKIVPFVVPCKTQSTWADFPGPLGVAPSDSLVPFHSFVPLWLLPR